MSSKHVKAEALVMASTRASGTVSAETREQIVGALAEDLRVASEQLSVEDRLLKIEATLRVLAEAAHRPKDE
jgi:hypothetical protein